MSRFIYSTSCIIMNKKNDNYYIEIAEKYFSSICDASFNNNINLAKNIFGNINYHIETNNAFISLSSLNEIRRMAFDYIRTDILSRYNKKNDIIIYMIE